MKAVEKFREALLDATKGRSLAGAATAAGLPRDAIRSVLTGHDPRLSRTVDICRALGLEFYIGPPREAVDPINKAREAGAVPPSHLRGLEASAQGLARLTADAGGDPIPEDLWPILEERRGIIRPSRPSALADPSALAPPANDDVNPPSSRPVGVFQIAAAAGGGAFIEDAPPDGQAWFRRDWLDKRAIDPTQCLVIGVKGESMEPTLPDGCSVLVDKTRRRRRADRIFVVTTWEGMVVKRAHKDDGGAWLLASDNPALESLPWPDDAETLGEVRWMGASL